MPEVDNSENLEHLHNVALDEYRFQVELNWKRSQYFFALSAAILAVAANTLRMSGNDAALASLPIFVLGFLVANLGVVVEITQKTYYRQARDQLRNVEEAMGIEAELRVRTTQGLGGKRRRTPRVGSLQRAVLVLIAIINAGGIALSIVKLAT